MASYALIVIPAGEYTTKINPHIRIDEYRTSNAAMLAALSYYV